MRPAWLPVRIAFNESVADYLGAFGLTSDSIFSTFMVFVAAFNMPVTRT